jgi:hypothetical protein
MTAPLRCTRSPIMLVLCFVVWTIMPIARADNVTSSGAATAKFEEGKQAFKAGRFAEALSAYQTSMALEPSPNTRFQIARCYIALGKPASAFLNFKRAAQEAQDRVNATQEKRYAATREAALSEAQSLEKKIPRLTLRLGGAAPEGFSLSLDGSEVPQPAWGLALEVDPGEHTVSGSGPRLQRFETRFTLAEAEQKQIDIPLTRLPTATLRFELKTKPAGLALAIDDQPLSPEQYGKPQHLDVGTHRVVGSAPGYANFTWSGFLADSEETVVPVTLSAGGGGGPPKWATFFVGGLAVAAFAVGIGFGVKARNTAEEQMMIDPLLRDPTVQDGVRTDAIIANAFFGVGGLLAINTVILAATTRWRAPKQPKEKDHPDKAQPPIKVTPTAGAKAFGLSLSGRF